MHVFVFDALRVAAEANSTAAPESEEAEWKNRSGESRSETIKTPISANMPLANTGKVKFDPPSVPVIFVLGSDFSTVFSSKFFALILFYLLHNPCKGGPGSGKVTHCDTLMEEKRGVTHINMMDLLHQHVISNGTIFQ